MTFIRKKLHIYYF